MIDQRLLRDNPKLIEEGLKSRGMDIDLVPLQKLSKDLKELEEKRNILQAQGNSIGKEVGQKINLQLSRTVLALWFAHRAQTLRQKALLLKPIIGRDSVNFF